MAEIAKESRGARLKITRPWVLRVAGSTLILGIVFWILPTEKVWHSFRALEADVFLLVFALFLVGHVASAAKWWLLIDRGAPYLRALRAHFAGLAANLCLPGVAGGDAVRAGLLFPTAARKERLVAGSLVDRLVDIVALALISGGGLLVLQDSGEGNFALLSKIALFLATVLGGVFLVAPRVVPAVAKRYPNLPKAALALKLANAFGDLSRQPAALGLALIISVAVQAGFVTLTIWLAESIGTIAPAGAWFFAWPLAKILAVLPISIGGLGVREAGLAALLTPFGADAAAVVAVSLVWQAVLFSAGLVGVIAWATTQGVSSLPASSPANRHVNK